MTVERFMSTATVSALFIGDKHDVVRASGCLIFACVAKGEVV